MSTIQLKPIRELKGMSFFIPKYQRGYRWKTRQVLDLLDDIKEFKDKNPGPDGMYCLQPLVVKKKVPSKEVLYKIKEASSLNEVEELIKEQWEVVDGQQRLTTLYLLIQYLSKASPSFYKIKYETREDSEKFLEDINNKNNAQNIDYAHIYNTRFHIKKWFNKHQENEEAFRDVIINRTEFIWYELGGENAIEVFTRLNIGKISLTNSELVKALFLNRSNFCNNQVRQKEIAVLWDRIEYELQKDEFWCFFHEDGYDQPTRIDFILELLVESKKEQGTIEGINWSVDSEDMGDDHYSTFRYFYHLFKNNKTDKEKYQLFILKVWYEIKHIFDIFVEWYNDNECYHYIGFLVSDNEKKGKNGYNFINLLEDWHKKNAKSSFIDNLKKEVKGSIKEVRFLKDQYKTKVNNELYLKAKNKTACYPLLLLFNVQSIVEKNKRFIEDGKFAALDFERFPFNLFKKEKGWDIEHIAPNTPYEFETNKERKEWLERVKEGFSDMDTKTEIQNCLDNMTDENSVSTSFSDLLIKLEGDCLDSDEDRNQVWNFCLLDQNTNRSYGNSPFVLKRKEILYRERGLDMNGKPLGTDKKADKRRVFIPACTLNAFTKFYSPDATNLSTWSVTDAEAYREAIFNTLADFDVKNEKSQRNNKES